ncbi:hypothetical protein C8Q74DRAFT_1197581 [Fomes fomentarius]|nr:hypothetical protein C8Q74DRAFT_1197581 [Fomes fomentarius]
MTLANATGLHIHHDSGAPKGSSNYTTLVLLHGYAWYSPIFARLLPLARQKNLRVVLVNRRDYPGTVPYTPAELALLPESLTTPISGPEELEASRVSISFFMKHRGHELLRFLAEFARTQNIPHADPANNAGGIIVAGWSMGIIWMNALLAHAASFWHDDVSLDKYVRRVILYDGLSCLFGFPPLDTDSSGQNPFLNPKSDLGESASTWISSYYTHGNTLKTLERRTPASKPLGTMKTMSREDQVAVVYPPPGLPGGSDQLLGIGGYRAGVFLDLWKQAQVCACPGSEKSCGNELRDVEVRVVWCDRSVWESVHAAWTVKAEVRDAETKSSANGNGNADGRTGSWRRKVTVARLRGGNHFAHWDRPEDVLRVFLADASGIED